MYNENISNKKASLYILGFFIFYIIEIILLQNIITIPATVSLITLNVIVFGLIKARKWSVGQLCVSAFRVNQQKQWYRIISSEFTHEAPLHILCNMYSLYNIGSLLESKFGTLTFSFWYFIIALIGGVLANIIHIKYRPQTPSIGASGVICGLIGIILVIGILQGDIGLIKWVGQSIFILVVLSLSPQIDSIGHFSGLIAGIITGFLFFLI